MLEPNPTRRWIVGVDIGGTNLVVGLVPADGGDPVGVRTRPTEPHRGGHFVVERIAKMVDAALVELEQQTGATRDAVWGVGIGSPGPLDRESGTVIETPNLGWENFPLRTLISRAVRMPAWLDNDANCAAYGEWWQGAGKGAKSLVAVTIGTGIGGGMVLDGELYHGVSDAAGEIGHMTIQFNGRKCACGNYGCLEAYASGPNIAARAIEGIEAGAESQLVDMVDGDLGRITAATVYDGAAAGDAYANDVIAETAKILGAGIANVINVLNPDAIVVTGGVTRAGENLLRPLRAAVRQRAFRSAAEACRIVPGALPDFAGMIGAAGVFKAAAEAGLVDGAT